MMRKLIHISAIAAVALCGLAACEQEGPAERARKKVDQATKDVGKSLENAGKDLQKK